MTKQDFDALPKYETLDQVLAAIKDGSFPKHEDVSFRIDNDSYRVSAFVEAEGQDPDVGLVEGDSQSIFSQFPYRREDLICRLLQELGVNAEEV